jgi:hypothetical protein
MSEDLIIHKGKNVIVVYNENPQAEALTLKGFCFEASSDFIHVKSSGNIITSIKKEWIRKIKTRGGANE